MSEASASEPLLHAFIKEGVTQERSSEYPVSFIYLKGEADQEEEQELWDEAADASAPEYTEDPEEYESESDELDNDSDDFTSAAAGKRRRRAISSDEDDDDDDEVATGGNSPSPKRAKAAGGDEDDIDDVDLLDLD